MNAVNGVNFGFTVQLGDLFYDSTQGGITSKTQKTQESNSFLSILNLLDVNADGKTDTEELKFGSGFMINNLIYAKDQNGDLLLSAEEAGVSSSLFSQLDTNSDGKVSAGEMITPANKIIDGLVPILDTNGDGALSQEELAIFELLFSGSTAEVSNQESGSTNPDQAFDMDTIPDRMRQAGFQGTDNQLYYVLASTYADLPWQPDPGDSVSNKLSEQREDIYKWFDKIVMDVADKMEANPDLTVTAIINDGPDRCGSRLGPAILEKLNKFGDRVQMGTLYA